MKIILDNVDSSDLDKVADEFLRAMQASSFSPALIASRILAETASINFDQEEWSIGRVEDLGRCLQEYVGRFVSQSVSPTVKDG